MLGGLSLGISVCRTCIFGHTPGLWAAPGVQHEPTIAMCPRAHCRDGDVDAESPTCFPTKRLYRMCKSAIELDVSYP